MQNQFAKILNLESLQLQVLVLKIFDKLPGIKVQTQFQGNTRSVLYFFGSEALRNTTFADYSIKHAEDFIQVYTLQGF